MNNEKAQFDFKNFFYKDHFYSDADIFIDDVLSDRYDSVEDLPEDWTTKVYESDLRPIHQFTVDQMIDLIDPDKCDEDGNSIPKVANILNKHINFDALNLDVPKLYYAKRQPTTLTKQDLLNYIN